ncbi:hypothetical protein DIPPA_20952 [Diplonema papillatum]|nr:hypothetical protein DIPPA_20952 [Diplonema papillatum]
MHSDRFVKQFVLKYANQILELTDKGRRQLAEGVVARVDHQLGEKYYAFDKFSDNLWTALFEGSHDTKLDTAKVNGVARAWRLSGLLLHCGIVRVPSEAVTVLRSAELESMMETINYLQRASLRDECLLLFDFYFYAARKGFEFDEFMKHRERFDVTKHQLRAVEDAWASFKIIPAVGFLWGYFKAEDCCQKATEDAILSDTAADLYDNIPDHCPVCNGLLGRLHRADGRVVSVHGGGQSAAWVSSWLADIDADTTAWADEMKDAFFHPLVDLTLTDVILSAPHASAGDAGDWTRCAHPAPVDAPQPGEVSASMGSLLERRAHELSSRCTMRNVHGLLATLLVLRRKLAGEPAAALAYGGVSGDTPPAAVTLAGIDEEKDICLRICEGKAAFDSRIHVVIDFFRSSRAGADAAGEKPRAAGGGWAWQWPAAATKSLLRKFGGGGYSSVDGGGDTQFVSIPGTRGDAVLDGRSTRVPPVTRADWERGLLLVTRVGTMDAGSSEDGEADACDRKTRDLAFVKHLYETMVALKRIRGPCGECVERGRSLAKCEKVHAGVRRRKRQAYLEANPTARPLDEYCHLTRRISELSAKTALGRDSQSWAAWLFPGRKPAGAAADECAFYRLRLAALKRELNRVTGAQSMRAVRTFFKFLVAYRKASVPARRCYSALCDITMEVSECMRDDMRTDSSSYLAELAVRKPLSLFVSQLYDLNRQIMEDPRNLTHNKTKLAFEENMLPSLRRDCFNLTLREHSLFYIKATAVNVTADGVTFSTRDSQASEYGFRFGDPYEMTHRIDMAGYQFFAYDELPDAAEAEIQKTFTTPPHVRRSLIAFPHQICSWTGAAKSSLSTYSR